MLFNVELKLRSLLSIFIILFLFTGCIGGFESTTRPSKSFYQKLEDTYSQNLWSEGFSQEKITAILYQSRRSAQIAVAVASWTEDLNPYSTTTMSTYLIAFSKGSVKALTAPEINAPDSDSKIDALERITAALSKTLKIYLLDVGLTETEELSFWTDYSKLLTTEAILTSNVSASSGAQMALDVGTQLSAALLDTSLSSTYLESLSNGLALGLAESIYDYRTSTSTAEKCSTLQSISKGLLKGLAVTESLSAASTEKVSRSIFMGTIAGSAKTLTFSQLNTCTGDMVNAAINATAFFFNASDAEKISYSSNALLGYLIGVNSYKSLQWSEYVALLEDVSESMGLNLNLNLIDSSQYQTATESYLESILNAAASTGVDNVDLLNYLAAIKTATDTGLTSGGFTSVDTSTMLTAFTPSCTSCDMPALPVFSYSGPLSATDGVAISAVLPTSTGGVIAKCSVTPALPSGLLLSPGCEISGTPSSGPVPLTTYTLTGENAKGSISATLDIEVL